MRKRTGRSGRRGLTLAAVLLLTCCMAMGP